MSGVNSATVPRSAPPRRPDPTSDDLRTEIIRLRPWHLDVQVTPTISTAAFLEASPDKVSNEIGFINPRASFRTLLQSIFPDGLQGRSVLDCACNCGGYLFWAKELGAGECFGFDAREHWIDQARFLARHRTKRADHIRFEVCDLYSLPQLGLGPFDITLFNGIFYHLPDPIRGLKIAADLTTQLMIVNTATMNGLRDGMLVLSSESHEQLTSGIYGLNWYPTGPEVLSGILNWLGFAETRCVYWSNKVDFQPADLGRIEMIGARDPSVFEQFDARDKIRY
jgi:tRNA (mo5U34)-methyltransferase